MTQGERALTGVRVGLSISESADSEARGFPASQINRITLQIVAAISGQGAGMLFGHDWRDDGVMDAVYGFVRQMQPVETETGQGDATTAPPLIHNLLAWPDRPRLDPEVLARLSATMRVESAGLPPALERFVATADDQRMNAMQPYIRARALTHLRRLLNRHSDARVCVGGWVSGSQGRYPGIIEEALLAIEDEKPLYLIGILGGAAQQVIDALYRREMPDNFAPGPDLPNLAGAVEGIEAALVTGTNEESDRVSDPGAVWAKFGQIGVSGLANANGLSEAENVELFQSPALQRILELVLTGLSRIRRA